jgi:uncharacterized protein (TIGR02099 family)
MRVIFRRFYVSISWITVVSIVILAVLLSIGRILSPLVQDYLPEIREQASRVLGQPVNIANIDIRWHGIAPSIHLEDIQVLGEEGEPVLSIAHIYIRPDFYRLMTEHKPYPSLIAFSGSQFTVEMLEDKRLVIPGIRLMEKAPASDNKALMASLSGITLSLLDSKVRWVSKAEGVDVNFSPVNVSLAVDEGLVLLDGNVGLPSELGKQLKLNARLEGDFWVKGGWSVKLHGDVEDLHLAVLPKSSLFRSAGLLEKGIGNVQFWLDWDREGPSDFRGRFDFHDLNWDSAQTKGLVANQFVLDQAKGVFHWQKDKQGWVADLNHVSIQVGQHAWPESALSVRFEQNQAYKRLTLSADYLHLGELAAIALSREELGEREQKWLKQFKPEGALRDATLSLLLHDGKPEQYSVSTRFEDLGWAASGKIPGVTGLDGSVSLNEQKGVLNLDSTDGWFEYPALFLEPLQVSRLSGELDWYKNSAGRYFLTGRDIKIANPDIKGEGLVDLGLGNGPADMELRAAFSEGNGDHIVKYLPAGILHKPVYDWLVYALKGGYVPEGQLLFKGRPHDFPFHHGEGIFLTRFSVKNGALDYGKGWPALRDLSGEVEFRNAGLNIDVTGGKVLDSNISSGTVRIEDLHNARLLLDARAKGPLTDVFSYLSQSPLGKGKEALLEDISAQGNSDLSLNINLPISKKLKHHVAVNGKLDFQSCSLAFKTQKLRFTDVIGELGFTEKSVNAEAATARIDGAPITIDARTLKDGKMEVSLQGDIKPKTIMQGIDPILQQQLDGSSDWTALLSIPSLKQKSSDGIHLTLSSDLQGVSSSLPAPLDKKSDEVWPIEIGMDLSQGNSHQLDIHLEQRLSAEIELRRRELSTELERAHIHFGTGKARLPATGIELSGKLGRIDFSAWEDMAARIEKAGQTARPSLVDKLRRMNLYIAELDIYDRTLHKLRINAVRQKGEWKSLVDSPWISGTIYQPEDKTSRKPIRLELDYLDLSHPDLEARSKSTTRPADFPSLSLSSKRLSFKGYDINNVNLSAAKRGSRLRIHALSFDADGFSGRINGDWTESKSGNRQKTELSYNFHIDDLGKASQFMKWDAGLSKGNGRISGTASWQGGPTDFSYENKLQGKVNLELEKGVITQAGAGAGKILGLFNLDALGKRIRMDFSDIQEEGYAYDSWNGQLSVAGPMITSSNMEIKGSVADLMLSGQGNIARRDMDVFLDVIPHVYSGVPIAGAVLGGPATGAALYLLGKIPGLSETIDRGSRLQYHLTGPWNAPETERLNQQAAQDEDTEGEFDF